MLRRQAHQVVQGQVARATGQAGETGVTRGTRHPAARHAARVTAVAGALLSGIALAPASPATAAKSWPLRVCHGTFRHPGTLAGRYGEVIVRGVCLVNHGPLIVERDVIITRNSSLVAAYSRKHSRLIVGHNIIAGRGSALLLGCGKSFPCLDDPHGRHHRSSHSSVYGSVLASGALGIVMHYSRIGHSVVQLGGGGGKTCRPKGIFARFHSPAYSAYEDNWIGRSITVRRVRSCWLGVIRNWIGRNATISSNKMADPDAMEVVSNVVYRDLTCWRNRPHAQFGDSRGKPNRVGLHAYYQCGFHVILPNPANQHVHFSHISVHLHRHHH